MFQNLCRSRRSTCRMPVSLSEWRVRIGTYVPRNVDPSEEQEMGSTTTTEHQSSTNMKPSKPEKQDSSYGDSDEQETPTATSDNTKSMPCKTSKKRKRYNKKGSNASGWSSGAFLSFRCFMKSGASPLLRFLLLVFTAILLVRSGDVEVNPGPNENTPTSVPDDTLINIAQEIPDSKLYELGHHLGFGINALGRYRSTNTMGGAANWSGTMDMLADWRNKTKEQKEELLRNALVKSSLSTVAEKYLPEDSPSESVMAARQRTSLEMPSIATKFPLQSQPMNYSKQQPYPSHMHYQSPHDSNQYAASSASQDPLPSRYQGVHHPYMTPIPVIPPALGTQGVFPPSYQMEPNGLQFQNQRLQSNHPSSSYGQFAPHGMVPAHQNTHTGAGPLQTRQHGELSTYPNTQWYNPTASSQSQNVVSYHHLPQPNTWESPGQSMLNAPNNSLSRQLASSQSCTNTDGGILPMVTQQERMHNISSHINVQGSTSTSNPPQEYPSPNMSRTPLVNSTSQQTVSCRLTPEQPHSTMCAGPSQMRTQSGTLHTAAPTVVADHDAPGMSSYQTPQNPSVSHSIASDIHEGYTYGTSRSNHSLNKRTVSGAPAQPTLRPTMDSTFSSSNSFAMPSTSGHTSTYGQQNPSELSTNCISPITDTQLDKCIADIKTSYRVNLCQVPTSPLDLDSIVELQCIFTNLFLMKEDRNTKKKIPLNYEDLLTVDINGEPAKRIMIQGEAGVGKTTFCAKIAWDWVTGDHYQDYTLVAVVPLRDAKNGKTVGQVLKTYLSDDNNVTSEQLDEYIKTNQHKVLTVFDGFDEFGVEMSHEENEIVQILQGVKHKSGRVIVTTRPWKAHEIANGMNLKKQYAFVKIEGFKTKDVKTYVTKFYRDDKTSAATLLEFMEEGSLVTEAMAPFPIFCSMLCHMWKEVERREVIKKLQTFSQLFQEMIVHLKEHYISKQATTLDDSLVQGIKEKIDVHFKKISDIAFNGLINDKLAFLEQEFESCFEDLRVALGVGLLTREKTISKRAHGAVRKVARLNFTFSFPHKLFQEYIAAVHLEDLFNSHHGEFDKIMKSTILPKPTQYKYLLYFTGSFNKVICKDILTRMIQENIALDLIVEVAFEGHSEEAANVIEEMDEQRSLTLKKGTSFHVISGYMFALKHLVSICLKGIPQSKILSRNLAEKVCSLQSLTKLELVGCNVPVSFSENLQRLSENAMVETFLLDGVKVTKNSANNLAKCICSLPHLNTFQSNCPTDDLKEDFFSALQSEASQSKVESLELQQEKISESASQRLGASICAMPCLKNVKLSISLADGFYSALGKGASTLKIMQMHLMGATLDSRHLSTIALIPTLKSLTLLDIKINDRSYTEEEGRDPSYIHASASLTELNVDHDSFMSLCGIGLLKRFPCIQKMTLAFCGKQTPFPQQLCHHVTMPDVNDLSLHGYYDICGGFPRLATLSLAPFPNLINLSLININIGNDNCTTVLDSLRNMDTLKTISIKDCFTYAGLDPLVDEINAEGKMTVTVDHGRCHLLSLERIFKKL